MGVFASVSWGRWLALMIPYSAFFFLVDSTVVWRVVSWFNARVPWIDILPIRASAYILSILNEQVGKGAMALYLNRRHGVPGWEVGSSMLFIMFRVLLLTFWASVGYAIAGDDCRASLRCVTWIALGALAFFWLWSPTSGAGSRRARHCATKRFLKAFPRGGSAGATSHGRAAPPALLAAVVVYTLALRLFGVEASFLQISASCP